MVEQWRFKFENRFYGTCHYPYFSFCKFGILWSFIMENIFDKLEPYLELKMHEAQNKISTLSIAFCVLLFSSYNGQQTCYKPLSKNNEGLMHKTNN